MYQTLSSIFFIVILQPESVISLNYFSLVRQMWFVDNFYMQLPGNILYKNSDELKQDGDYVTLIPDQSTGSVNGAWHH